MFRTVLRLAGIACGLAGLCHLLLGVDGDWIVGVGPAVPINPSLDSQNRFYGTAFILYGALLWIGASDMRRYALVLKLVFGMMLVAGMARGLAVLAHGWPSPQILFLWSTEVILPPVMGLWLRQTLASDDRANRIER
jgi:Domain of unknown function (DUF4345)